eukprot:570364-Pyramimonas_sp.AAC.1
MATLFDKLHSAVPGASTPENEVLYVRELILFESRERPSTGPSVLLRLRPRRLGSAAAPRCRMRVPTTAAGHISNCFSAACESCDGSCAYGTGCGPRGGQLTSMVLVMLTLGAAVADAHAE